MWEDCKSICLGWNYPTFSIWPLQNHSPTPLYISAHDNSRGNPLTLTLDKVLHGGDRPILLVGHQLIVFSITWVVFGVEGKKMHVPWKKVLWMNEVVKDFFFSINSIWIEWKFFMCLKLMKNKFIRLRTKFIIETFSIVIKHILKKGSLPPKRNTWKKNIRYEKIIYAKMCLSMITKLWYLFIRFTY